MTTDILRHLEAGVLTLTFNRVDKKNAITGAMYQALADHLGLSLDGLRLEDVQYAQTQESVLSEEFHKPAHMLLVDFLATTGDHAVKPNEEIEEWAWVHLHEALDYPLNAVTRSLVELALRQGEA